MSLRQAKFWPPANDKQGIPVSLTRQNGARSCMETRHKLNFQTDLNSPTHNISTRFLFGLTLLPVATLNHMPYVLYEIGVR